MTQFGYACLNTELREKGIFNSRTMRKKTFLEKGLPYTSELCLQNVKDILTILNWNHKNDARRWVWRTEMGRSQGWFEPG